MAKSKRSHKSNGNRVVPNGFASGGLIQGGILRYRLTDFVDYNVPKTSENVDRILQYGLAPINTIPGMFGTSDDLKKLSLPACRPLRLNLSVLPYAGLGQATTTAYASPENSCFTVRSACPIAYPTSLSTNPIVSAAWNQQAAIVTPTVNPEFIRVATWDFRNMPQGSVFQTSTDTTDIDAVMGVLTAQVLNVNSDTQYKTDLPWASKLQFRIDIEFELPMPALSQVRNVLRHVDGERYFTEFDKDARAGDSNMYLIVEGFRRSTDTLPSTNSVHGRMALMR